MGFLSGYSAAGFEMAPLEVCVSTAWNSLASLKDGEALQDEWLRAKTQRANAGY